MKQIFSLCLVTLLLAGCGASSHGVSSGDTVNIGYGTQDKDKLSTAVSNVKVKKTEAQTYTDMYEYLRGRVPGVMVTSDKRIIIRGIGTNSDSFDPLILVDDVETTDLSSLNPADAEGYDFQPVGDGYLMTARFADGTTSSFILTPLDGGASFDLVALNP
jgi:TonB-dependent Receptor Plug Domain.